MVNKVTLIGRVGKEVELRYTQKGTPVANLSLATTEKVGETEETEWHSVVVWSKTAENVNNFVSKGDLIYVYGRIKTRSWEKDGQKHYTKDVIANRVVFMTKKSNEQSNQEPPF